MKVQIKVKKLVESLNHMLKLKLDQINHIRHLNPIAFFEKLIAFFVNTPQIVILDSRALLAPEGSCELKRLGPYVHFVVMGRCTSLLVGMQDVPKGLNPRSNKQTNATLEMF